MTISVGEGGGAEEMGILSDYWWLVTLFVIGAVGGVAYVVKSGWISSGQKDVFASAAFSGSTKSCSECGVANPESANYCHLCGEEIGLGTISYEDEYSGPTKRCSGCSIDIPEESEYCFACGD